MLAAESISDMATPVRTRLSPPTPPRRETSATAPAVTNPPTTAPTETWRSLADILGRVILDSGEMEAGVVTAFIGGPVLLLMVIQRMGVKGR